MRHFKILLSAKPLIMKYTFLTLLAALAAIAFASCKNQNNNQQNTEQAVKKDSVVKAITVRNKILTAEEQKALTPDMVMQRLQDGNRRFLDSDLTVRDHSSLVRDARQGQYPMAVILSCMDSRVPVEDLFDCAIGDLFVCRVAGNVINPDILGSLEYGCKVSGSKLIVVMGHKFCGAVKSAIKDVKLGNISQLLVKIKPAIAQSANYNGDKTYNNEDYITQVAIANAKNVAEEIKKKSPLLKEMIDKGELKIVAAGYNLKNGEVVFFQ